MVSQPKFAASCIMFLEARSKMHNAVKKWKRNSACACPPMKIFQLI